MNKNEVVIKKVHTFIRLMASQTPFNSLRCLLYKLSSTKLGINCKIDRGVRIKHKVKIGNNVIIKRNCYLEHVEVGDGTVIDEGAYLLGTQNKKFSIGNESYIGYYSILDGSGGLEIGDYVHIASPSVGIWTHSSMLQVLFGSKIDDNAHRKEGHVKIGNNIWIGGKVTIYPNIELSDFCVVLPNSAVNKNVPPNSMVGGTPIKLLKKIVIQKDNIQFVDVNERIQNRGDFET